MCLAGQTGHRPQILLVKGTVTTSHKAPPATHNGAKGPQVTVKTIRTEGPSPQIPGSAPICKRAGSRSRPPGGGCTAWSSEFVTADFLHQLAVHLDTRKHRPLVREKTSGFSSQPPMGPSGTVFGKLAAVEWVSWPPVVLDLYSRNPWCVGLTPLRSPDQRGRPLRLTASRGASGNTAGCGAHRLYG